MAKVQGRNTAASEEVRRQAKKSRMAPRYFDWGLVFIVLFLIGFGLVMLYSVSSYNAMIKFGTGIYYVKRQLLYALIGLVGMVIAACLNYQIWYKFATPIYVCVLVLNALVLVAGATYGGSTRWLSIGGMSVQPSEFAKIGVIIFLSAVITRIPVRMLGKVKALITMFVAVIPAFLLVAISNLSTSIIILGIAFVMVFVASPKYKQFVGIIVALAALASVFLVFVSYRMDRIQAWLHPEESDNAYQTLQGLYAIGSGGIFGKGLGESLQKLGYVPEPENDMIFSIICEELGLVGAICVILLFFLLLWRLMVIASNADDIYGSFLVVGIMAHIAIQVVLNIAVVTNSIPNTGVTLPFISYGGTSLIVLMTECGLALSVSHGIRLESLVSKEEKQTQFKSYLHTMRTRD